MVPVRNADGSLNAGGSISHFVPLQLQIEDHLESIQLLVTDIGNHDVFLGHDWLAHHNPSIHWKNKSVEFSRCPQECTHVLEEGDHVFQLNVPAYLKSRAMHHDLRRQSPAMDIAIERAKEKTKKTYDELVPAQYRDFPDVFTDTTFNELPPNRPWDHAIELRKIPDPANPERMVDPEPVSGKIYNLSPSEQQALDVFLEENLATGRIRPSKSPWGAPFFFVKKKDGKLRPVQDYRKLNTLTVKNKYPLPLISEIFDKLKDSQYFSKLDIRWGYNNVRMKQGDEAKAAFITNRGLFEPTVMFFGLCNSPATFQTMMDHVFQSLVREGHVIIYLDDILIFTKTLTEHRQIVRRVLELLREHKLTCKPEKCEFEVQQTEYLGHIISPGEIRMDPDKVRGISEWPIPKNKKDVQSFLGFCNFYRRFIKDFAKIATPLNRLTGKAPSNAPEGTFPWTDECTAAFQQLKDTIAAAPIIVTPNNYGKFRVECDASQHAMGAVLSQEQDGQWRIIAFMSKSLEPAEKNYQIYDRELLSVIRALKEWRHYLLGAAEQFEVWNDHKNLEYFRKPQDLTYRQARWHALLQEYDFTLHHQPGSKMTQADALSRRVDHFTEERTNVQVTLLPEKWFVEESHICAIPVVDSTDSILTLIKQHIGDYSPVLDIKLRKEPEFWHKSEDGLIYRGGADSSSQQLVVPSNREIVGRIIASHHDSTTMGHPGIEKTRELIQRSYWWPAITKDVDKYVKSCQTCQRIKIDRQKRAAPLHPNPIPTRNWENISVDEITHLPPAYGFNAILVIVCMKSKDYLAIPISDTLNSEGFANLLIKHVIAFHGLPKYVFSDRGSVFVSAFVKTLYAKLGIQGNPSTAYHPWTDGQTERANQEIETYLRAFTNFRQSDWPDHLPMAAYSYRIKQQSTTGFSPFFLTHGHEPYTGVEMPKVMRSEGALEFAKRMRFIQEQATKAIEAAQTQMKTRYDKRRQPSRKYEVGDWVWLAADNISTERISKKMDDKRYGPFQIVTKIGTQRVAYELQLPPKWRTIHPVFNEIQLLPYKPPEFPNQTAVEYYAPDLINPPLEVEIILDSKVEKGQLCYLIKWMNRPRTENTWEGRDELLKDVPNCRPLLQTFHAENPTAPRMPTIIIPPLRMEPETDTRYVHTTGYWNDHYVDWQKRRVEKKQPVYSHLSRYILTS